jgi:hypothetical protein
MDFNMESSVLQLFSDNNGKISFNKPVERYSIGADGNEIFIPVAANEEIVLSGLYIDFGFAVMLPIFTNDRTFVVYVAYKDINDIDSTFLIETISFPIQGSLAFNPNEPSANEKTVFEYANIVREHNDLNLLVWNDDLGDIARKHSSDMRIMEFVGDTYPDGSSIWDKIDNAGITYKDGLAQAEVGFMSRLHPRNIGARFDKEPWDVIILNPDMTQMGVGQRGEAYSIIILG